MRHDGIRANHTAVAKRYAGQNPRAYSNEHAVANFCFLYFQVRIIYASSRNVLVIAIRYVYKCRKNTVMPYP